MSTLHFQLVLYILYRICIIYINPNLFFSPKHTNKMWKHTSRKNTQKSKIQNLQRCHAIIHWILYKITLSKRFCGGVPDHHAIMNPFCIWFVQRISYQTAFVNLQEKKYDACNHQSQRRHTQQQKKSMHWVFGIVSGGHGQYILHGNRPKANDTADTNKISAFHPIVMSWLDNGPDCQGMLPIPCTLPSDRLKPKSAAFNFWYRMSACSKSSCENVATCSFKTNTNTRAETMLVQCNNLVNISSKLFQGYILKWTRRNTTRQNEDDEKYPDSYNAAPAFAPCWPITVPAPVVDSFSSKFRTSL